MQVTVEYQNRQTEKQANEVETMDSSRGGTLMLTNGRANGQSLVDFFFHHFG